MIKTDFSKLTSWEKEVLESLKELIITSYNEDDVMEETGDCENFSVVPNYKKSFDVLNKYSENVIASSDKWFIVYKISDDAMIELMEINCFHQYGSGFIWKPEEKEKQYTFTESELIEFLSKNMKLSIDENHENEYLKFTINLQLKSIDKWKTISSVDIKF